MLSVTDTARPTRGIDDRSDWKRARNRYLNWMNPAPLPPPRQTQSYVQHLLQSRRLIPKNKMGQNFLIDLNLLELVVSTAELSREDSVLEVGTGTGSLTSRLADSAGAVTTVELDPNFHRMAASILAARPNVSLVHADALARKNELNPQMLSEWDRMTLKADCIRRKLVANLPYAVATPVIANLLITGIEIERMVVMTQWEMAERLAAASDTKDYGSLAVLVQSLARVQIVRRLAPSVFWPRPKVDSAIVMIRPDLELRKNVPDAKRFRAFLRDLYTHRRKNLRQAIAGWPSGRQDKKEVDAVLERLGIDGSKRAETLSLEDHRRLAEAFAHLTP
jgi:16S rRNA (adenine1518-N6/adenine1519-N6)-dimethyltransferase